MSTAHGALDAANVPRVTDEPPRHLSLEERITLLVRDRDEARKLAEQTARELARMRDYREGKRKDEGYSDGDYQAVASNIADDPRWANRVDSQLVARWALTLQKQLADAQHALANERQVSDGLRDEVNLWRENEVDRMEARAEARAEVLRLTALINTPRTDDFFEAVRTEAAHQIERWGAEHDAGKRPEDWLALYLYLLGKATKAHYEGNREKLMHHIITVAAVALNWHRNATGVSTAMRPGVGDGGAR